MRLQNDILLFFLVSLFFCSCSHDQTHQSLSTKDTKHFCNEAKIDYDETANHANKVIITKPQNSNQNDQHYRGTILQMIETLSQESYTIQKQGRELSPIEMERLKKIQTIISHLKEVEKNL